MTKILTCLACLCLLLSCKSVFLRGTDLEDGPFKDDNTTSIGDRSGEGNGPADGSNGGPNNQGGPNNSGSPGDSNNGITNPSDNNDNDDDIKTPNDGYDNDDDGNNRNDGDIILGCTSPLLIYLVLDSSGSMKCNPGENNPFTCPKSDNAKVRQLQEAAWGFINLIERHQNDKLYVGLAMFDTSAREVTPIGRNFEDISEKIK